MKNKQFINELRKEYDNIITQLLEKNLLREHTEFSFKEYGELCKITRNNRINESNILFDRNKSIEEVTDVILKRKEYNLLLYDKGIFQFEFIIEKGQIKKERLVFIKKHNKLWDKEEINNLSNNSFDEDWYNEIIGIPIVIRVDFDEEAHIDVKHPITHMTLSNYDECRIPMKGAVSLTLFINFILNMFYDEKLNLDGINYDIKNTISENEKKCLHFNW